MKKETLEYNLTPYQLKLFNLYRKAYGEVILWSKKDKKGIVRIKLLNPEEVTII